MSIREQFWVDVFQHHHLYSKRGIEESADLADECVKEFDKRRTGVVEDVEISDKLGYASLKEKFYGND